MSSGAAEPPCPKDFSGGKGHKGKSKAAFKGKLMQLKGTAKGIKGLADTGKGKAGPAETKEPVETPDAVTPSPADTSLDSAEPTPPPVPPMAETPTPQDGKGLVAPEGASQVGSDGGDGGGGPVTPPPKRPIED